MCTKCCKRKRPVFLTARVPGFTLCKAHATTAARFLDYFQRVDSRLTFLPCLGSTAQRGMCISSQQLAAASGCLGAHSCGYRDLHQLSRSEHAYAVAEYALAVSCVRGLRCPSVSRSLDENSFVVAGKTIFSSVIAPNANARMKTPTNPSPTRAVMAARASGKMPTTTTTMMMMMMMMPTTTTTMLLSWLATEKPI